MQPYYPKKRKKAGPSKNDEKVQRAKEAERLGGSGNSLGSRYPSVERLVVSLNFLSSHQADLGTETRTFAPNDACNFAVPCPGPCGAGDFNLAKKIESVITNREPASEATGKCGQPLFAGSKDLCGCELKCRINVSYKPLPPEEA